MKVSDMTLGVLAGGKNSRMGRPKALLTNGKRTFIENILCEGLDFGEIIISLHSSDDEISKYLSDYRAKAGLSAWHIVTDERSEYGPVEGIYQILKHMHTDAALVVASDMPNISSSVFTKISGAYDGKGCMALSLGGHFEPLCSIYHKSALSSLSYMRANNLYRPRLVFERCHTQYVSAEDLDIQPDELININTMEDYIKYK